MAVVHVPLVVVQGDPAPWLSALMSQLGVKEVPGDRHNPAILRFHGVTALRAKSDEVAWCSSAVCWALESVGLPSTRSAAARSWLTYGRPVTIDRLSKGDILLFRRNGGSGYHVGLLAALPQNGWLSCLGGNQGNAVSIVARRVSDLAAVRRPV